MARYPQGRAPVADQRRPQRGAVLGRAVQLPAQLADERRPAARAPGRRPPWSRAWPGTGSPRTARDCGVSGASSSRDRGPHSPKQAQPPVTSAIRTDSPLRRACRRSQPEVVRPERGAGDHQELVGGHPGHGHVQLDAGAVVERLGVGDRARCPVDPAGEGVAAERGRVRTGDLDRGERALVEQAGRGAHRLVLGLHAGRPFAAGPAARPQVLRSRRSSSG